MAGKQLEENSKLNGADTDGNGIITDEELDLHKKRLEIEDEDAMRDAQRNMAWFALWGMLLYPFGIFIASFFGSDHAADVIGDMSSIYFLSVAAIVMAFYGKEAITAKNKNK